jgi:hypothetical protein
MLSLIATVLILAFLLYTVWPWFWHIMTALALVLLVFMAWPWLQRPWEDLTSSWLQQLHASPLSPQRTAESRPHFEEPRREAYPRPYPEPILVDRWRGHDVFAWRGECWVLRHNEEPYRYLCVVRGRLQWCW